MSCRYRCWIDAVVAIAHVTSATLRMTSRVRRLRRGMISGFPRRRLGELVAHAVHGQQQARAPWVDLELSTQVHDVRVDGSFGQETGPAVNVLQQLASAEYPAGALGECGENVELDRGDVDPLAGEADLVPLRINAQ